jgi:AAA15 family ATPase/GTPase
MILNIKIKNFRSFKDETIFSMVAEASKSKEENVLFETIGKNDQIRVLNTSVIIGANASGKSTLIRGMFDVIQFITKNAPEVGSKIRAYDTFAFNANTKNAPVEFSIDFVLNKIKYSYSIVFDKTNINKETLEYFPLNKKQTLIQRKLTDEIETIKHTGYIGSISKGKKVDLFHNQLFLQKFGKDIPHEIISDVYLYFKNINILNAVNQGMLSSAEDEIKALCNESSEFQKKLNNLISFADVGINKINVSKVDEDEFNFPDDFSKEVKNKILKDNQYRLTSFHNFYKGDDLSHPNEPFPFNEESHGTKTLFALGGKLLHAIANGRPIFVDEIETSLHSNLTKMLISLFKDKKINNKNAQLICTSHDTNILDKNSLRKDQVWLAEKNSKGETDLFSLQDFADVREDTPFDKWYLAGKFGALPILKSLNSYFSDLVENEE